MENQMNFSIMTKDKMIIFSVDDETLSVINGLCASYDCSIAKVFDVAIWTLNDVLFEGNEYDGKISLLHRAVKEALHY